MNRLQSFFYHKVHTHGALADTVYKAAYPVKNAWFRMRNWVAEREKVTPEELYEYRHLMASGNLVVGVTNVCNARCIFCAYPRAVDNRDLKGGVMPLNLFKKIVDEWKALGGDDVDLTHTVGDPLVDPGLLEKIDYAIHQAGIKRLTFTTNGILLNRNDNYRHLINAGVKEIYISTEGTNAEVYEKVYGVKHYDDMLSGVHNLLEYNRLKGEPTSIAIRFRNSQKPSEIIRSQDFLRVIKPYFSEKVRCNFTVEFDNWGGLIKDEDLTGNMRLRKRPKSINVPCRALFGFLVRYDGSVRLCGCRFVRSDMDDMVVGNLREQTLFEISKSSKAWEIIKGFYSGKRPETCVGCSLYHPINQNWFNQRMDVAARHKKNQMAPAGSDHGNEIVRPDREIASQPTGKVD